MDGKDVNPLVLPLRMGIISWMISATLCKLKKKKVILCELIAGGKAKTDLISIWITPVCGSWCHLYTNAVVMCFVRQTGDPCGDCLSFVTALWVAYLRQPDPFLGYMSFKIIINIKKTQNNKKAPSPNACWVLFKGKSDTCKLQVQQAYWTVTWKWMKAFLVGVALVCGRQKMPFLQIYGQW